MPKIAKLKIVQAGLLGLINDLIDVTAAGDHTGVFGGCDVGLFTAWPGYRKDLVLGDLTESDFTGYARESVTWGAPYTDFQGQPSIISESVVFRPTDAVTGNVVFGFFIVNGGGDLVAIGAFDESVILADSQDQATVILELEFDPLAVFGQSVVQD